MRKYLFAALFFLLIQNFCFAREIPVKIKPIQKITTSNLNLQEGDSLDFEIAEDVFVNEKLSFKKGEKVSGVVTSLEENNYLIVPAKIYIENFKILDNNNKALKLKGFVYKTGNYHRVFGEIFVLYFVRGGEVQIKPEKDEFTIYYEENL